MEEINKVKYIENNPQWRSQYGSLLGHLYGIADDLRFFNHFIKLESSPLRVVDYGCANGYFLRVLRFVNPGLDLYGVEIAEEAAKEAEEYIGRGRIFWQSVGAKIPLEDESVDLIYSISVIEHIPNNAEIINMLKECQRMLKKSGYLFLRSPNCILPMKILWTLTGKSWIWKKGAGHSNPFTARRLEKLVMPYLKIEKKIYNWGPSIISKFLSKICFSGQITIVLRKY